MNGIIIIMSRCQHRSPWPNPATCLYRSSPPGYLQGYILFRHRAVVYRFQLCNLLTLDQAVNQETGASGRRYRGITLTCGQVEFSAIATPTGAGGCQIIIKTRCHRRLELIGVSCSWSSSCSSRQWEPAPDRGLVALSDPRLSSPAEWERSAAIVRWNWVNMLLSVPSPTHLSHIININPFATLSRIKCERYIFRKKCVRSSVLLIMFPHVYVYV